MYNSKATIKDITKHLIQAKKELGSVETLVTQLWFEHGLNEWENQSKMPLTTNAIRNLSHMTGDGYAELHSVDELFDAVACVKNALKLEGK